MFRNQYDTDVTVWSPQGELVYDKFIIIYIKNFKGRLHQVEYAAEAVNQVL